MANYLKKKCIWLFLVLLFLSTLFNKSRCSELDDSLDGELETRPEGVNKPVTDFISMRPEGAVGIDFKRSLFDKFKREVMVDKYYTKDGKKVKVILRRKERPIFKKLVKWRNKRKAKKKAKKLHKKNKPKKKKRFNFWRFRNKKAKLEEPNESGEKDSDSEMQTHDNSLETSEIFEGKFIKEEDVHEESDNKKEILAKDSKTSKESTNEVASDLEKEKKSVGKENTVNSLNISKELINEDTSNLKKEKTNTSKENTVNSLNIPKEFTGIDFSDTKKNDSSEDSKKEHSSNSSNQNEFTSTDTSSVAKENIGFTQDQSKVNSHILREISSMDFSKSTKGAISSSSIEMSNPKTFESSIDYTRPENQL